MAKGYWMCWAGGEERVALGRQRLIEIYQAEAEHQQRMRSCRADGAYKKRAKQ